MVSLFVVYGRPLFLLLLQHVVSISFAGRSGQGSRTAFPMNDSSLAAIIFSTHGMGSKVLEVLGVCHESASYIDQLCLINSVVTCIFS